MKTEQREFQKLGEFGRDENILIMSRIYGITWSKKLFFVQRH